MYRLHITFDRIKNVFMINIINNNIELDDKYYLYECSIKKRDYDEFILGKSLVVNSMNGILNIDLDKYFIISLYEINCGIKVKISFKINDEERLQFLEEIKKMYLLKPSF